MPSLRLGLLGGTFDPPHFGHLVAAQEVVELLSLNRMLFMVAGLPPHKLEDHLSPPRVRVEMARAAVAGNPYFEVNEIEVEREGPSYTVDTLQQLRSAHPDAELFLVLGSDQVAELHEWQDPEGIARLATLIAVGRTGVDPRQLSPVDPSSGQVLDFRPLDITRLDISSTEIRARVREGRSIQYLVPESVRRIIETHRLYRSIP